MKTLLTMLGAASLIAAAQAGALPKGDVVRIEGTGIESGWHAGKVMLTSEGCTLIALNKPTLSRYTAIALIATARLERLQAGTWVGVPVRSLQAQEPKHCLVEGSD